MALRRLLHFGLLLISEIGSLLALWLCRPTNLTTSQAPQLHRRLAEARADDVLVAAVWAVAVAVGLWLLASTLAYLAVTALRLSAAARRVGWATLPGVRRAVDGLVAGSIVAGAALGTAAPVVAQAPAAIPGPTYVPRPAGDGPAYVPVPAGDGARPATTALPVRQPDRNVAPLTRDASHLVEPGEHLWGIARAHLAAASGRPAVDLRPADVAPYWRRLIDANTGRLRSGDPDLIHPGEELVLPDVDG